eukprot:gene8861-6377_t
MACVDKENDINYVNRLREPAPGALKPASKPRFGSMLAEARKEVQVEGDNLLAIDFQADEVAGIVKEWVQENQDQQLAAELAKTLDEEDKANRKLEILRGENEALKVAVEEKRRLKADAEEKMRREAEDEALARKFIEDEEKEYQRTRAAMLYADEKLCRQLSDDADEKGVVSRQALCDSKDERKDWDQSDDEEDDDEEEEEEEEKADDASFHAERVVQQLEHDFELARHFQRQLDLEARRMKTQLEAKDEAYSRKLQAVEERKAFMAKKRAQLRGEYETHANKNSDAYVGSLWEDAEADVDNVQNALCLTLLLPNVANVQVKLLFDHESKEKRHFLRKKNPVIRIEATRAVKDRATAKVDNANYIAEFQLDPNAGSSSSSSSSKFPSMLGGKRAAKEGLKLSRRDIYFEYASESGLLHVFVENILLDESVASKAASEGTSAKTASTKAPALTTAGSVKNLMLKQFQSGVLRIFGGGASQRNASQKKLHK